MARDEAYQLAEQKIEAARKSGAKQLDLSGEYGDAKPKLTELPESLGQLTQLQSLDLSNNQLTALPESLGQLTQLQSLDLHSNRLTALPESLGQLTHLQTLNLSGNQLTALPESLGRLTQLQSLELTENQLTALPESLGQLTQLQTLEVGRNSLTMLPTSISNMRSLETLKTYNNNLRILPESIGELARLQNFDIGPNQLTDVPPFVRRLRNLHTFRVDENNIAILPAWMTELAYLRTLTIGKNPLICFPDWLGNLKELRELSIERLNLTDLPASLAELSGLELLFLDDNPLNPELAAAYKEGLNAVKRYLRAKSEAQVVLNEAKLILIGEGEVGKSALLGALRGDEWMENRDSTHGIEIKPVKVTDPATGTEITLNGWDFGGQRVYRPTHQLFFSAPAVYLVVWKPREGSQAGAVKEWIKLVKHREPDAKILVVATHGGPGARQPDIDRQEIWDLFGKETVIDFFHVDSRPPKIDKKARKRTGDCKGIKSLKETIARVAAGLPEMGRSFPQHWQEARQALSKSKEAYLPLNEVFAICKKHKVKKEDAHLLIRICRSVGDLIYYEHDPVLRDIVVLKPDWLATAMSFVFDDEQTRDVGHGLVSFERLGQLWSNHKKPKNHRYPAQLHPIFLRLMERFDLSYRVAEPGKKDEDCTSLIAQLVPDVRPETIAAWPSAPTAREAQQVQICRIVDMANGQSASAEGLFFQLIVRLHKYSLGRANYAASVHWQRGLVLEDDTGARAFLEHHGNDVRITVRSPYPERFLAALTYDVKWLVEYFWKGMQCEVTVPCLATNPDGQPCKGLFNVSDLIDDMRDSRPEQKCPVCKKWQNIEQLLRNAPAARPNPTEELLAKSVEVLQRLEQVRLQVTAQHHQVIGRFDHQDAASKELVSKVEAGYAGLIRMLLDEGKEGPRLFSLQPVERSTWNPNGWVRKRFKITLWCEHTRLPLPLINKHEKEGVYEFDVTREWFAKAAPFLKVLAGTLSLVLPVAASTTKLVLEEATYKALEDQLDFGKECAEAMLGATEKTAEWLAEKEGPEAERTGVIRADGGVLREFQGWLKENDKSFGDLRRVLNKRQEFLWVHKSFEKEY